MSSAEHGVVLVVDDDQAVGTVLEALLTQAGYQVHYAPDGVAAAESLAQLPVDVMITDFDMPGMNGMELLGLSKERWPEVEVVMLTAHGSIPLAVRAMQGGAADFLVKPFEREEVLRTLQKAVHLAAQTAKQGVPEAQLPGMVGASVVLKELAQLVQKVAQASTTVLIQGETGTGKELLARAIHELSPRAKQPFVVVNCAALPESLLESELFGHEKGAFTGATHGRPGRVRMAEGGTLFLDEIGEVPLSLQPKLLRLLEQKEVQSVGSNAPTQVNVRFITATHRNLAEMVAAQSFREDLFYRLNVMPLHLPALRERPDDIPVLAQAFCKELAAHNSRGSFRFSETALNYLSQYPWPGNIRELRNLVERLVVLCDSDMAEVEDIQQYLGPFVPPRLLSSSGGVDANMSLENQRKQTDRAAILHALERTQGNRSQAARILGISRRSLYNKLADI